MNNSRREGSLARSLHVVENIRNRLLLLLARLFQALSAGNNNEARDNLCEVMLNCYLLGKRLGISYQSMDEALVNKARDYVEQKEAVEEYFGDITDLLNYYQAQKK